VDERTQAGLEAGRECLAAALDYLRRGWSALCLCPPDHVGVGKWHVCNHPGKVPLHRWEEYQVRLPDEADLRHFFHLYPNANTGMATGKVSGVIGVDVDPGGEAELAERSQGDLPPTPEFTSGDGRRLLYATPEGVELRTTHVHVEKKKPLSFLATGAQTVMPPSRHVSGRRYCWVPNRGPDEIALAPAPAWLVAELKADERRGQPALFDGEVIAEGCRNDRLTSIAGRLRHKPGLSEGAIRAALLVTNAERCSPPLPENEVNTIACSVARYEPDAFAEVILKLPEPSRNGRARAEEGPSVIDFGPIVPASLLKRIDDCNTWLWRRYLARGAITMLSALWKAGKTTLLSHALDAFGDEERFLGEEIRASRVLYVTEEHESLWAERRDLVGLGDHAHFLVRPFTGKPDLAQWLAFLRYVQHAVKERGYDLVVFDTISNLWCVRDENDAAKVQEALMPLRIVSDLAAVLLVHHVRKGDGTEATASRGSGALPAFVDILLELRRFDASDRQDRRRVLSAWSRYREVNDELVIELAEDGKGYQARGNKGDEAVRQIIETLAEVLPGSAPGATYAQVVADWPGDTTPRKERLFDALDKLVSIGKAYREGEGRRGSPWTWWMPPF